jgi:4-hydroxy-3-methylbut-2-enyl diphosphate reductase
MKIIRSQVLGFCMGVRRAVELAVEEAMRVKDSSARVFTLGPLIHNPGVLEKLKSFGVRILDEEELPASLKDCSVIIRAHGIAPKTEKELESRGARIIDATCPKVKANQLKAAELSRDGYYLFLAGEREHAEIKGLLGYAGEESCSVISSASEAEAAVKNARSASKTALVGQTTISENEYNDIAETIKNNYPDLQVIKTICSATKDRQNALRELLTQVDAVIIAGGKDSANTRRLLAIARENGKPGIIAEAAADIPEVFFNYGVIGLGAGASTPDSLIGEIETFLIMGHI